MASSNAFTVYMYGQEKSYLEWLVLQRQTIETGGDLFGLWQKKDVVIVQLVLGPGKSCTRTETSFYQDVNYLSSVGEALTTSQGLCNIGEWHSHHRIDLPSPSPGDQTTVWKHMKSVSGGRFLVFIASITGSKKKPQVNIGCFMFSTETRTMTKGLLVALQGCSPIRGQFNDVSFAPGPEQRVSWGHFLEAAKIGGMNLKKTRPHEVNGNKQAKATAKEHREKTPTRETTDKTKLISNRQTPTYGSANHSEVTKHTSSKPIKNKKLTMSARFSKANDVVRTQPMRDIASPSPESGNNVDNKPTSIFDCC